MLRSEADAITWLRDRDEYLAAVANNDRDLKIERLKRIPGLTVASELEGPQCAKPINVRTMIGRKEPSANLTIGFTAMKDPRRTQSASN